ncbi:hypothetical protein ACP4OV_028443 [Aristida adscensionis]
MLNKRLQGCLLLVVFLIAYASGSRAESTVDPEQAAAPAAPDSEAGERRSLATAANGLFCVAKQGADPAALQTGLNWACGPGHADCTAIQQGGPCYKQNNLPALASYAYNDYYQRNANSGATCSFNGTATTTPTDPSSGQCVFAGSSMAGGGTTPSASAPSGLSPPSSFTPGTGGTTSFGSPVGSLVPLDGAESVQSGARWALGALLLLTPLVFLL